jgi:tetratricopeptide (TPR) repeat protein
LRQIEARAFAAQKAGRYADAIGLWRSILDAQPNWEHGYAQYYLADCYVRTKQFQCAEEAYRRAVEIGPQDKLFTAALQSFLQARQSGAL